MSKSCRWARKGTCVRTHLFSQDFEPRITVEERHLRYPATENSDFQHRVATLVNPGGGGQPDVSTRNSSEVDKSIRRGIHAAMN